MHPIQEPFDHAEGDEAPDVDAVEEARVLHVPGSNLLALFEGAVELDQCRAVQLAALGPRDSDVAGAFVLDVWALEKGADFGGGGVDGAEGEDVEEEDAVVVEKVPECFFHEAVVRVGL